MDDAVALHYVIGQRFVLTKRKGLLLETDLRVDSVGFLSFTHDLMKRTNPDLGDRGGSRSKIEDEVIRAHLRLNEGTDSRPFGIQSRFPGCHLKRYGEGESAIDLVETFERAGVYRRGALGHVASPRQQFGRQLRALLKQAGISLPTPFVDAGRSPPLGEGWEGPICRICFAYIYSPRAIGRHTLGVYLAAHSGVMYAPVIPPSTTNDVPVMNDDSSLARNSAAFAISSGRPKRPMGM